MKHLLQNLLVFLSACLCALIAFQWHREAKLRQNIQTLTHTVQDKLEIIQNQQVVLRRADTEIERLDGIKSELTETVKSNYTQIAQLMNDLDKSGQEIEKGLKQIETYKGTLQQANDNIKTQNESIKAQNERLKKHSDQYSELAAKYNKVVGDFNDLAKKWNDAQAAAAAAATNSPPKK